MGTNEETCKINQILSRKEPAHSFVSTLSPKPVISRKVFVLKSFIVSFFILYIRNYRPPLSSPLRVIFDGPDPYGTRQLLINSLASEDSQTYKPDPSIRDQPDLSEEESGHSPTTATATDSSHVQNLSMLHSEESTAAAPL